MAFLTLKPDEDLWRAAVEHPFVLAVGDGSLSKTRFETWLQQDHHFVVGLRGFIRQLVAWAPETDRDGLHSGLAALEPELELFRRSGVDLTVPPVLECTEYLAFLQECAGRGYTDGLAAYYACERSYLDAWSHVRERGGAAYRRWIDNWTSEPFEAYVVWLGERLEAIAIGLDESKTGALTAVMNDTVRHEIAFWDACYDGSSRNSA
jgi:thiaminase/transcriptional activator TenA